MSINFGNNHLSQSEANHISENIKKGNMNFSKDILTDYKKWYQDTYTSEEIKQLQKALNLPADGNIGTKTLQAIINFEKKNGNGKIDGLINKTEFQTIIKNYQNTLTQQKSKTDHQLNALDNIIKPNIEKKLNLLKNQTNDIIKSQNDLIKQYKEDTGLGVKWVDNVFGGQQVLRNYESTFENGKDRAKKLKTKIEEELKNPNLTNSQKNFLNNLIKNLNSIINQKFEGANLISMAKASWDSKGETAKSAAAGARGVAKGTIEGVAAFFTSIFDLTVFTYKYLANGSEHRDQVHKQISEIWELVKNVDKKILESAIKKAVEHINSLPPEQQSEEIGRLGGLIIGFLIPMGVFSKGTKLVQSAKAKALSPAARMSDKVAAKAISLGLFTLNGPVESLIGAGLSKTLRGTINIVKGKYSIKAKINEIDKTVKIIDGELLKNLNNQEKSQLEKAKKALLEEKEKLTKENVKKVTNASKETTSSEIQNQIKEEIKTKSEGASAKTETQQSKQLTNSNSVNSSTNKNNSPMNQNLQNIDSKNPNIPTENKIGISSTNLNFEKIVANSPDDLFEKLKKSFNIDTNNLPDFIEDDTIRTISHFFKNPEQEVIQNLYDYLQKNPDFDIKKYIVNFYNNKYVNEQVIELLKRNVKLDSIIEWKNTIGHGNYTPSIGQVNDAQGFIDADILYTKLTGSHSYSYSYGNRLGTDDLYNLARQKVSNEEILKTIETIGKMESEFEKPRLDFILERIDKTPKEIIDEFNSLQRIQNINNLLPEIPDNEKIFTKYFTNNQEKASKILHKIRSSENKKEDLEKFKILMREQQLEVDNIIQNSLKIMNNNPNISFEELLEQTLKNPEKFDINQKSEIITKLHEGYRKIQLIEEHLIKYKDNPNELLELTLGKKIESKIKMKRIDTGLIFYITNEKDYVKFFGDSSGGQKFQYSNTEDLSGSISVIRGEKEGFGIEASIHEARHNLNDIIFVKDKPSGDIGSRIKDEIIAFIKDGGRNFDTIKYYLNSYYKEIHTDYARKIEKNKLHWEKKQEDGFFDNKHDKIVESGMKNAIILQDIYGKETALNLMSITDIEKWHRLIPKDYQPRQNLTKISEGNNLGGNIAHGIAQIRGISNIKENISDNASLQEEEKLQSPDIKIENNSDYKIHELHASEEEIISINNDPIWAQESLLTTEFQLKNEIKNIHYLQKMIGNTYIQNIESPTHTEIISILENPDLRKQAGHTYIFALQSALSVLGFGEKMGKIDGFIGSKTLSALKDFQSTHNIGYSISDKNFGRIDLQTTNAIIEELKKQG